MSTCAFGYVAPFAQGLWVGLIDQNNPNNPDLHQRNPAQRGVLTAAVAFCTEHGAWLTARILLPPIKSSRNRIIWLLQTGEGPFWVPDRNVMAVTLEEWMSIWYLETTIVSKLHQRKSKAHRKYRPAYRAFAFKAESHRRAVIEAALGSMPDHDLPMAGWIKTTFRWSADRIGVYALVGDQLPEQYLEVDLEEVEIDRLTGYVEHQIAIHLGIHTAPVHTTPLFSIPEEEEASYESLTASIEDTENEVERGSHDASSSSSSEDFDPRAIMSTPELRRESLATLHDATPSPATVSDNGSDYDFTDVVSALDPFADCYAAQEVPTLPIAIPKRPRPVPKSLSPVRSLLSESRPRTPPPFAGSSHENLPTVPLQGILSHPQPVATMSPQPSSPGGLILSESPESMVPEEAQPVALPRRKRVRFAITPVSSSVPLLSPISPAAHSWAGRQDSFAEHHSATHTRAISRVLERTSMIDLPGVPVAPADPLVPAGPVTPVAPAYYPAPFRQQSPPSEPISLSETSPLLGSSPPSEPSPTSESSPSRPLSPELSEAESPQIPTLPVFHRGTTSAARTDIGHLSQQDSTLVWAVQTHLSSTGHRTPSLYDYIPQSQVVPFPADIDAQHERSSARYERGNSGYERAPVMDHRASHPGFFQALERYRTAHQPVTEHRIGFSCGLPVCFTTSSSENEEAHDYRSYHARC